MVGGVIINIVRLSDSTWVQCMETTVYHDSTGRRTTESTQTSAIRVKDAPADMKCGDRLWWQGRWAMWTPKPDDGREDVHIERIGYSHSSIPADVFEAITDVS
jgi:hypothetical protein